MDSGVICGQVEKIKNNETYDVANAIVPNTEAPAILATTIVTAIWKN